MTASTNAIDLNKDSIVKLFFYYFIPSLCAMLAMSTYSTIDGIFVGNKIGEDGLSAITICWPIFPAFIAYELLFGFGGAAIVSYFLGKNQAKRARLVFSSIFYFVALSSLVIGSVSFFFAESVLDFLIGGKNISYELYALALEYIKIIFLGVPFLILHPLSDIFVINDKRPLLGMTAMIVGSASNIVLNYILLFECNMGIGGSALATILAHLIGFVMLLSHFLRKKGALFFITRFSFPAIISSAKSGLPESISEISASIVMMLFNITLLEISGKYGVTIYGIIMYCGVVFFTILLSVSQALQPIASFNYGAGNFKRLKQSLSFALVVVLIIGFCVYGLFFCFDHYLVALFLNNHDVQADTSLIQDTIRAMSIYYLGYILLGINIACAVFLQSVQRTLSSFIITVCYTIVFLVLILPPLSARYGLEGAWISYPIAQVLAFIVAICVLAYEIKFGIFSGNLPSGKILWKRKKNRV